MSTDPTTDEAEAARRRAAHAAAAAKAPGGIRIARSDRRGFLDNIDDIAAGRAVVVADGEA